MKTLHYHRYEESEIILFLSTIFHIFLQQYHAGENKLLICNIH